MVSAAEITNAALQPLAQAQSEQIQALAESDPQIGSAVQAAHTATQWQVSLVKQLLTFEGNAVSQLLAPLDPSLGQQVDFKV